MKRRNERGEIIHLDSVQTAQGFAVCQYTVAAPLVLRARQSSVVPKGIGMLRAIRVASIIAKACKVSLTIGLSGNISGSGPSWARLHSALISRIALRPSNR